MGCHHQIEKAVKGYMDKSKDPMQGPYQDPTQGCTQGPALQVQEEVQEEEKEEVKEKKEVSLRTAKAQKNAPTLQDFYLYASSLSIWDESFAFQLEAKYEQWVENNWKDGHGKKIKNWKTKLRNTLPYFKKQQTNETFKQREQRELREGAAKLRDFASKLGDGTAGGFESIC